MPQVLFHCREFYFTAASFSLLPRVLFYRHEFYFHHRDFNFDHREINITAASFIFTLNLGAVK